MLNIVNFKTDKISEALGLSDKEWEEGGKKWKALWDKVDEEIQQQWDSQLEDDGFLLDGSKVMDIVLRKLETQREREIFLVQFIMGHMHDKVGRLILKHKLKNMFENEKPKHSKDEEDFV